MFNINTTVPYCDMPQVIPNGEISRIEVHLIRYTCEPKYTLVGNSDRECIEENKWSGTNPRCLITSSSGNLALFKVAFPFCY